MSEPYTGPVVWARMVRGRSFHARPAADNPCREGKAVCGVEPRGRSGYARWTTNETADRPRNASRCCDRCDLLVPPFSEATS